MQAMDYGGVESIHEKERRVFDGRMDLVIQDEFSNINPI
jgi:hypothetical protein